jgi:hypothetical protein
MTKCPSMTLGDLQHKFAILAHFKKCYYRAAEGSSMRKLMIEQTKRLVSEIKHLIHPDGYPPSPVWRQAARGLTTQYDLYRYIQEVTECQ